MDARRGCRADEPAIACCSFEDGLKLVKLRGESMQAAADAAPSAMISVIGLDSDKVRSCCSFAVKSQSLWVPVL